MKKLTEILTSTFLSFSLSGLLGCSNQYPTIHQEAQLILKNTQEIRKTLNLSAEETCNIIKTEGANNFIIEIRRQNKIEYLIYEDENRDGRYDSRKRIIIDLKIQPIPETPSSYESII